MGIYREITWLVTCDECFKTMHTNASSWTIALETAERKGWKYKNNFILCPKCAKKKATIADITSV